MWHMMSSRDKTCLRMRIVILCLLYFYLLLTILFIIQLFATICGEYRLSLEPVHAHNQQHGLFKLTTYTLMVQLRCSSMLLAAAIADNYSDLTAYCRMSE